MKAETRRKYAEALELYATTGMSCRDICRRCGLSVPGFQAVLLRYCRELVLKRYGVYRDGDDASRIRLRSRSGQTPAAYEKYRAAIRACDSTAYIEFNVSQVARIFGLSGTGLGNQLRLHYPEILERREVERHRLGLNDNQQRGVRPWCLERYAAAVELLRTTDKTVAEAAAECGVSASGLSQHVLFYHKELIRRRAGKRQRAVACKRKGGLMGNGRRHEPLPELEERYREAVRLYDRTPMTLKEIAGKTGVGLQALRHHLHTWHKELVLRRWGAESDGRNPVCHAAAKRYLKSTAAKYAEAIARLRDSGLPTAAVAAEFGLNAEVFRQYLRTHAPDLHARNGCMMLENGRSVSRRSMEKYAEALRLYAATPESLKSIARRLSLQYNSLSGFVRRNFPDIVRQHRELLPVRDNAASSEE